MFNYFRNALLYKPLKNANVPRRIVSRIVTYFVYNPRDTKGQKVMSQNVNNAREQFNTGYYRVTRHQELKISSSFPEITISTGQGVSRRAITSWHFNSRSSRVLAVPLDSSDLIP